MARVNLHIKTQMKQDQFKPFSRTVQDFFKWPGSEFPQPNPDDQHLVSGWVCYVIMIEK